MLASVIIYTYRRKDYILKALRSAANQTLPRENYEIIVVKAYEDAEIDSEIDRLADVNMLVDSKAHGKKLAPAIREAKGDVVFLLDDDDEFVPEKLEKMTSLFTEDRNLVFSHNSIIQVDEKGNSLEAEEAAPPKALHVDTTRPTRHSISAFMRYRANWYSSCMGYRRDALMENIDYLERVDQSVDPFLFFMALSVPGKMVLIPDRLTRYRVHSSTTNFTDSAENFVSRRHEFYQNTLRIYEMALDMARGKPSEGVVRASISHIKLMTVFLSRTYKKGELFRSILSLIASSRIISTRYYGMWIMLSSLKLIIGNRAMGVYYRYNAPKLSG